MVLIVPKQNDIRDHCTKCQPSNSKPWKVIPLKKSMSFFVFLGGWGGPILFKISDPKQNDISKHYTKSQPSTSKRWKVIPSRKPISLLCFFFVFLGGLGWSDFFQNFGSKAE